MKNQPPSLIDSVPAWRTLFRWTLAIFAAWLIIWLLWQTGAALAPFIVGLGLAYLLLPLVGWLERRMPRWAAIALIYVVGLGVFIAALVLLVPPIIHQFGDFFGMLPDFYRISIAPRVAGVLTWYREAVPQSVQNQIDPQVTKALDSLKHNAFQYANDLGSGLLTGLTSVFRTVIFLLGFLIVPFWLFFVLMDEQKGKAALDRLLPSRIRPDFWAIAEIFDRSFSAYVRGQLILSLIVSIIAYILLWIVDLVFGIAIPYKLLLALVAGITELIPVIGPVLGLIPAVIVGLGTSLTVGLIIAGLYIIVQPLENNFLVPRVLGDVVEVPASILMLLLLVAGAVGGVLSIVLVVPVAAVARDLYRYLNGRLRSKADYRYLPAGALPVLARGIDDMDG